MSEFLVVGGGLAGLAIGWRLARAGREVRVLERDPKGAPPSTAAWGAAGMLAPLAEAGFDEPDELRLGRESLARYPDWIAELEQQSGESVGYRTEGTLMAALDRDDAAWLRRQYEYQQEIGLPTRWLSGREALEMEPHLAPSLNAAVLVPTDHQVDARRMWSALRTALLDAGGRLEDGVDAREIRVSDGRATGVRVRDADGAERVVDADAVVVCGGAWTRQLMSRGLPADAVPPIRPVKGQVVVLGTTALLRPERVVRSPRVYIVPKQDGRLVLGATSEEVGFDTRNTAGGVFELLRDAWEAMPGIYDLPLLECWAGLRPASRDHKPVLGRTPVERLFVAAGYYRNGVLLTPVTAHLMAELLLHGREPELLRPFRLARFHARGGS